MEKLEAAQERGANARPSYTYPTKIEVIATNNKYAILPPQFEIRLVRLPLKRCIVMSNILTSVRLTESRVTLARRYCKKDYEFWFKEYGDKRSGNDYPYTYTDEYYNLFSRYNVLNVILLEVETLTEGEFSSLPDCRELLVLAGQIGETIFTTGKQNEIAHRATS